MIQIATFILYVAIIATVVILFFAFKLHKGNKKNRKMVIKID
jgi:Co/Zn/Cd efflux system component